MSNLTGKTTFIHGSQHYLVYAFRDVDYTLNGDYTQIGHTIFAKGVSVDGQVTWADEDGSFLSALEASRITDIQTDAATVALVANAER